MDPYPRPVTVPARRPATVLLVCTGNVCRSPAAERVLAARLTGTGVRVVSAGTRAVVGAPASEPMGPLVEAAGGTLDGFVARQLTAELVDAADLVLTMTREHRSAVSVLSPAAVRRTTTLREAAHLLRAAGRVPGGWVVDRVRAVPDTLAATRGRVAPLGADPTAWWRRGSAARRGAVHADDVVDPIGGSDALYRRSFGQILPAVDALAAVLLARPVGDRPGGRARTGPAGTPG